MNELQIAFLYVGPDVELPTIMVRSIRATNKNARIFQCSDPATPEIEGIDKVFRMVGDASNLMTFRLECFARLNLNAPTFYLDTDMLIVSELDSANTLHEYDIAVCSREFGRSIIIDESYKGMNLSEYSGKTFGEVYPYLACTTVTRSSEFWSDCLAELKQLNPKFHYWYGDQEAIRNVVKSGKYRVKFLPESVFGYLPGKKFNLSTAPRIYHFKGTKRKDMMIQEARNKGLLY